MGCNREQVASPLSINISVPYDPDSLDPHVKNTVSNFAIACHLYEPLVRIDGDMNLQAALAESWENPDTHSWIFRLRKNVHFHSGKAMTATDVVYSFRRLLNDPSMAMRAYLSYVTEVEALDNFRVRIRTRQPVSVFLNKLSFVLIVPDQTKPEDFVNSANGTGPYTLVQWEKGKEILLKANPDYHGKAPSVSQVLIRLNRTPEQAIEDLNSNQSQLVQSGSRRLGHLRTLNKHEILVRDSLFVQMLGFDIARNVTPFCDQKRNPFQLLDVRKAIHLGLDRRELVEQLPSFAVPLSQPVPPFVVGYNPAIAAPFYDPEEAKKLLAKAGFPDGFTVTLHSRHIFQEAAEGIRKQLSKIGIQVRVELLSSGDFYGRGLKQDFSFYLTGFGCPTGDSSNLLELALHTTDPTVQLGEYTFGRYSNPDLDRAMLKSARLKDSAGRQQELQRILGMVMEDLPLIPLYIEQQAFAIDRKFAWKPRFDAYLFAHEIVPRNSK